MSTEEFVLDEGETTRQSLELEIRALIADGLTTFGLDVTVPIPPKVIGNITEEDIQTGDLVGNVGDPIYADTDTDATDPGGGDLSIWSVAVIAGDIMEHLVNCVLPEGLLPDEDDTEGES